MTEPRYHAITCTETTSDPDCAINDPQVRGGT